MNQLTPVTFASGRLRLAVRLRGHYLAIASLGFAVIVHQVLVNWIAPPLSYEQQRKGAADKLGMRASKLD